jgi:hypothetical protein
VATSRSTRGVREGPRRRFDEGGPTAHGPVGGSPPRSPGPGVPRRQSAVGRTAVARREL